MVKYLLALTAFLISISLSANTEKLRTPWGPPLETKPFLQQVEYQQVYRVPADPDSGFHHPYFFVIPKTFQSNLPILVNPNNDGLVGLSTAQREYFASILNEEMSIAFGSKLGVVTLSPVFPRPKLQNKNGNLYLHALTRAAVATDNPSWQRVDLQLLAMHRDLRRKLNSINMQTTDSMLLYGFSAAGDFVTRFTLLHPKKVTAVVAGGLGGLPILPVENIDGELLTYPVGVGDFEHLFERSFDKSSFAKVPMLFVQGSIDENDSVAEGKQMEDREAFGSDSYSYDQALWVNRYFGTLPIDRLPLVRSIYQSIVPEDFAYAVLPGEKHSDKHVKPNVADFFQCVLEDNNSCAPLTKKSIESFESN